MIDKQVLLVDVQVPSKYLLDLFQLVYGLFQPSQPLLRLLDAVQLELNGHQNKLILRNFDQLHIVKILQITLENRA